MAVISGLLLTHTLFSAILIILAAYVYSKLNFMHWKRRGVPTLNPSFPFGSMKKPIPMTYIGIQFQEYYRKLKLAGHKHGGFYQLNSPKYFPMHPELLQQILQRDFQYFTERGLYYNKKSDIFGANLFTLGGQRWRDLRTKLTPAFTSCKIRSMYPLVIQCANQMKSAIDDCYLHKRPIDAKEMMSCYTTDVIGSCAFGLECNTFINSNSKFRQYGDQVLRFTSLLRIFKAIIGFTWPNIAQWLGVTMVDKEVSDFYIKIVRDTIKYRNSNNIERKDMLQLLMELEEDIESDGMVTKVTANAFLFFIAGFETSSATLAFCLYELASNLPIQKKLRDEIITVLGKHKEEVTYDAIKEMNYLDQVVDETLRKYPAVPFLIRQCEKNYMVPNTNLVLEAGTDLIMSILGLHHDPEYYPDPEMFDPERFSEENKRKRINFTYIPFGEGHRICIGLRFALMQIKIGLVTLLKDYKLSLNAETTVPLEFEDFAMTMKPKFKVLLNVMKS